MIRLDHSLLVAPSSEPLTTTEAKLHASISQSDEDTLIASYIVAARQAAEAYLGRGLFTQTRLCRVSTWADVVWLPMAAPLQSVTHIKYYAEDGTLTTLPSSAYVVDAVSEPGRVVRAPNQTWPTVQAERDMPIEITYVCGWSNVANIPELIKQGLRLHVAASEADRLGSSADAKAALAQAQGYWAAYGPVYLRQPSCP